MGKSMPVTPREGMAAATIIMMAMVTSSPHCRPHCRLGRASTTWTVIRRKKSRQYAAGVDEEKPMGVPLTSMVVWGTPKAMATHSRAPRNRPRKVMWASGRSRARGAERSARRARRLAGISFFKPDA